MSLMSYIRYILIFDIFCDNFCAFFANTFVGGCLPRYLVLECVKGVCRYILCQCGQPMGRYTCTQVHNSIHGDDDDVPDTRVGTSW